MPFSGRAYQPFIDMHDRLWHLFETQYVTGLTKPSDRLDLYRWMVLEEDGIVLRHDICISLMIPNEPTQLLLCRLRSSELGSVCRWNDDGLSYFYCIRIGNRALILTLDTL